MTLRPTLSQTLVLGLAALISAGPALAGVKLITLPARERVEIQLELVEEERVVPLARGANDVVFKWANTNIDKSSIQFRCLTDPGEIKVLSVSYPPGENALTWQVFAPKAGSARVRISYIIGQLDKSFAYRAIAANDEKTLTLWQGDRLERPIGINETKRLLASRFDDVPIRKTYTADFPRYGYLDAGKRQLRIPMHYVLHNETGDGMGR
jgi:hypothetical protein